MTRPATDDAAIQPDLSNAPGETPEDAILSLVRELEQQYQAPINLPNIQAEALKRWRLHPSDTKTALANLEEDGFLGRRDGGYTDDDGAA